MTIVLNITAENICEVRVLKVKRTPLGRWYAQVELRRHNGTTTKWCRVGDHAKADVVSLDWHLRGTQGAGGDIVAHG